MKRFLLILASLVVLCPLTLSAQSSTMKPDKVAELMKSAFQKYQKGDLNGASSDLEEAKNIIDGKRQDFASKLFPDIEGWKALKAEKEDAAVVGGKRLHRAYESGAKTITAELFIDSPMIASLGPLLNNPDIAKGAGFETRRVDGMDALIKQTDKKIELNVLIGAGILFKLTGDGVKENELVAFAKKFDLKAMEKLKKEALEKKDK